METCKKPCKYGDVHPATGLVFLGISYSGESADDYWVTKDQYAVIENKLQINRVEKKETGKHEHKIVKKRIINNGKFARGDVNEKTGKIFWAYQKGREYWMDGDTFLNSKMSMNKKCNEAMKRNYQIAKSDPKLMLEWVLRSRVRAAFRYSKSEKKRICTTTLLGADWAVVKSWIESLFEDGMTWENRGSWHIDHIIPLGTAINENDLVGLCHYTNLRPLWAVDNLRRSKSGSDLSSQWPRASI